MKIYDIITIILFLVTLVIVFGYIFGNSPTLEQGLLILILTFLFTTYGTVRGMEKDMVNNKSNFRRLEDSLIKLGKNFKEHTTQRR
ncbi:MAG TPA: hypothetical protein VJA23_04865 [Candidatus Nanoarchaeia archaeon]|nr:hypothetical protein [Candidatus Nanoarchaeia archaeon]